MGTRSNRQGETQLLAEWLTTQCVGAQSKTHVFVGSQTLVFQGQPLSPAMMKAFSVWSDWADARVAWPNEVWLVEAKIVGTAGAYGQALDYASQYSGSLDYQSFLGKRIVPMVVCAYERPRTSLLFGGFGVRTAVYTPSWASKSLSVKIQGSSIDI